jgi:hypothetical protein
VKVTDWPNTDGLTEDATVVVVLAWFTICVTAPDVLVVKLLSPLYTAVIECEVTDKAVVANVAVPPLREFVDRAVAPSLKVTVPVGVPLPGEAALTVAVNVTDCPKTVGLVELLSAVVLLSWLTVCVSADDVLVLKLPSPLYTAVIECDATLNELVLNVAVPELKLLVASDVAPSLNVTVPVGVPAPGAAALTVAVKVTAWPETDGLTEEATALVLPLLLTL